MKKEKFFKRMAKQGLALTFDDVRLLTGPSTMPARLIPLESRFTRNVAVKVPIVSAAMDTVTTAEMAIAMAMAGGIGVIHTAMTPEKQAKEVKRVKLFLNGKVEKPITVPEDWTLEQVENLRREKSFTFHSFPVVNANNKLVGLVTRKDFQRCPDLSRTVESVMATEIMSASTGTKLDKAYTIMMGHKHVTVLPLVNRKQEVTGLYLLSDVLRVKHDSSQRYNVDKESRLITAAAVGTSVEDALERIALMREHLNVVVVDSAQGDSEYALTTIKAIKESFADLDVMAGNISRGSSAVLLAKHGVDGIKVGQGPGAACITRPETGIGTPQVTAVYRGVKALKKAGIDVPICADGGITTRGDVSIALGAGAHSVMIGGMLAGTKEAPGQVYMDEAGNMVQAYRGMGSKEALENNPASRERYGAEEGQTISPEGEAGTVAYRGTVVEVMEQLAFKLARSLDYCGMSSIEEHRRKAQFDLITHAGKRESGIHNMTPTGRTAVRKQVTS